MIHQACTMPLTCVFHHHFPIHISPYTRSVFDLSVKVFLGLYWSLSLNAGFAKSSLTHSTGSRHQRSTVSVTICPSPSTPFPSTAKTTCSHFGPAGRLSIFLSRARLLLEDRELPFSWVLVRCGECSWQNHSLTISNFSILSICL